MKTGERVNGWISVSVHSRCSGLCAEYILSTSKFVESTNIGEYHACKSILAITREFMREHPRMWTNIRYLPILDYSLRIRVFVDPA